MRVRVQSRQNASVRALIYGEDESRFSRVVNESSSLIYCNEI